ncbi:MAG: efflux RND transporter periplasmic adaptor subunit, partial [Longimicrobiales bacterium]
AQARANLVQARATLERAEALAASDARLISQRELDEARTQLRVQEALHQAARFRVDQSQAALRESQDQLSKTVIRAPLTGIVTRLNIEQGEMAIIGTMNNPGSLLLTISDLSIMEAVVQVDETDVPDISIGDTATVEVDAFTRQQFRGVVTEIGHSAVQSPAAAAEAGGPASQIPIDFEVVITLTKPPPTLRPDLSATADIITARRDSALSVPIIALTVREVDAEDVPVEQPEARRAQAAARDDDAEREGVFLVRGGKAEFVPVTVGIAAQEYFEVLSGLQLGDSIVAGPYDAIREMEDGDGVRPLPAATTADASPTGT